MKLKWHAEGDIELLLPESTVKLDELPKKKPQGMKLVDYWVRYKKKTYLIEIKDPSHPDAPEKNRMEETERIKEKELIAEDLVPKVRGSYTWLHLMEEDEGPIIYIVLLGISGLHEKIQLLTFKDRLKKKTLNEAGVPWKRRYISDFTVVSDLNWNQIFRKFGWQLKRSSSAGSSAV